MRGADEKPAHLHRARAAALQEVGEESGVAKAATPGGVKGALSPSDDGRSKFAERLILPKQSALHM